MDLKTYRNGDLALLHPAVRGRFNDLATELKTAHMDKVTKSMFLPFETYRHPLRQQWLKDVQKASKAGAFESPHQFGLAVDFVAYDFERNKWSWDNEEDWEFLKKIAEKHGLTVPISWDRVHVEHPGWRILKDDFAFLARRKTASKATKAATEQIFAEHLSREVNRYEKETRGA